MSYCVLHEKLGQGTLVLTANVRLADKLINSYLSDTIAIKPQIQAFSHTLSQAYAKRSLTDVLPICLDAFQTELIWQQIIAQSDDDLGLINPLETAKTVARAYRHLKAWGLNLSDIDPASLESSRFLDWATQFEKRLSCLDAIITEQIPAFLQEQVPAQQVMLAGFDDLAPAQKSLIDAWEKQGVKVSFFEPEKTAEQLSVACDTPEQELVFAALKAKALMAQKQRVTVIVPDLNSRRDEIIETFMACLEPQNALQHDRIPKAFRITGGQALSAEPIVTDFLLLLQARERKTWLDLICSPYLPDAGENRIARESIKTALEKKALNHFAPFVNQLKALDADKRLQACFEALALVNLACTSLGAFKTIVLEILEKTGFPGNLSLGSCEYQALKKVYEALDHFTLQHFIVAEHANISFNAVLSLFEQYLKDVLFQPESEASSPITVCGMLEAVGEMADVMIITGLNQHQFPPRAKPNPYLPIELQRAHQMPHADGLRQLQFASTLLDNLCCGPKQVIATYAKANQEITLAPAALIADWPVTDFETKPVSLAYTIFNSKTHSEEIADWSAAQLPQERVLELKGGVSLFRRMAACPFQAFAAHRLNLQAQDEPLLPLDLMTRGVIMHDVLDKLYANIQESDQLSTLAAHIEPVIESVLRSYNERHPGLIPKYLKPLEAERLNTLIKEWLLCEKERPAFEVCAHEKSVFGRIGGIPIHGRIDRVDKVGNQQVLIDYKSGKADKNAWLSERLPEPQLPIYAILTGATAIAFAKVASNAVSMTGIAQAGIDQNIVPANESGMYDSWEQLVAFWQQQLKGLSAEFLGGDARVAPLKGDVTCQTCDFKTLCRREWL